MQFSLRNLILAIAVLAVCITLVGRVTRNGTVIVSQKNDVFVQFVLGNHGIRSWELEPSLGETRIFFPDLFVLTAVDDAIVKDALKRGYCIKIEYNAIIPQFSSERIVNE